MKSKFLMISTGFAMFSMFFGSGNLVYPLLVGSKTASHWALGSIGLLLTGVFVPFLGILGVVLYDGCTSKFFGSLGKKITFWLSLFCLSLMGPFGVLARCITVAHGSFRLVVEDLNLPVFSLIFLGAIFIFTLSKKRMVSILGSVLTPLLILSLICIAYFGLTDVSWNMPSYHTSFGAMKEGLTRGYQLMDLLAAFFFSAFIYRHIKEQVSTDEPVLLTKLFLKSACIGVLLLSTVYIGLVLIGAIYSDVLQEVPTEQMLGSVATLAMGEGAGFFVCVAVVLACFTTALVLATLYADFLRIEVFKAKLHAPLPLIVTLLIAFIVSTLEFSGIEAIIGPILKTIYPALIAFTVINICHKLFGSKQVLWPIGLVLTGKLLLH